MAQKRFYKDLRTLAKRANQRMVELEKRGMKTPAYEATQAILEMAGNKVRGRGGRRFSETGKATYNEYELMKKFVNRFLNAKTSTVTGTNKFYDDVWEGAKRDLHIENYGITKKQYMEIWENLPKKKKDRLYGSGTIIKMVSTVIRKKGEAPQDENRVDIKEIIDEIQASENTKDAYKRLGIDYKDMEETAALGSL